MKYFPALFWLLLAIPCYSQDVNQVCSPVFGEQLMETFVARHLETAKSSRRQFEWKAEQLKIAIEGNNDQFNVTGRISSLIGDHSRLERLLTKKKVRMLKQAFALIDQMDLHSSKENCLKMQEASLKMQEVSTLITSEWRRVLHELDKDLDRFDVLPKDSTALPNRPSYLVGTWTSMDEQFSDIVLHDGGEFEYLGLDGEPFNTKFWFTRNEQLCINVVDDIYSDNCINYKFEKSQMYLEHKEEWINLKKEKIKSKSK